MRVHARYHVLARFLTNIGGLSSFWCC